VSDRGGAGGAGGPDEASGRCELTVNMHQRIAHIRPGLTALDAFADNLALVGSALDGAGVRHFAVRGMDDRIPVVGVCADDRERVVKALVKLFERITGYVMSVLPKPPLPAPLHPGEAKATWTELAGASVIRLVWFRTEPTRSLVLGEAYGCELEFWTRQRDKDRLLCPRHNRMMRVVPIADEPVQAPAGLFTRLAPLRSGAQPALPQVRTRPEFTHRLPDEIDFPVDVVYTWVDGLDPDWRRRKAEAAGRTYHDESASDARFINRDELRYSLRSLHSNAPWVRNIYILTDDQTPSWLDTSRPNVHVVSHKDVFSDPSVLPVFNSHAIESQLHHIDGLAEHFVYFNDDMFVGRPLAPQAFFLANGLSKMFFSQTRVPLRPVAPADTPVDAALKNNRVLIEREFGRTVTQTFQHVPYPLRRSVLTELEERFADEHRATMASRFRSLGDISIPSSLYHYYAFATGRALPSSMRYGYIQLAVPDLADRLARLLARRDWDVFCLNDAFSTELDLVAQNELLLPFFEAYFPVASPYEKQGGRGDG